MRLLLITCIIAVLGYQVGCRRLYPQTTCSHPLLKTFKVDPSCQSDVKYPSLTHSILRIDNCDERLVYKSEDNCGPKGGTYMFNTSPKSSYFCLSNDVVRS